MKLYKSAWFVKFARKERISDAALCEAIDRAECGLIDADLGSGLIKQRAARDGEGKSGGFRTLIFFRREERAVFAFGFAKSDRANIDAEELAALKAAARHMLGFTQDHIEALVKAGRLMEVRRGNENL